MAIGRFYGRVAARGVCAQDRELASLIKLDAEVRKKSSRPRRPTGIGPKHAQSSMSRSPTVAMSGSADS